MKHRAARPSRHRAVRPPRAAARRRAVLAAALLATLAVVPLTASAAEPPMGRPAPGTYKGLGFDTCSAPSSATMDAWRQYSPYRAIGIYFGGISRGCAQPNLTRSWVLDQQADGWTLMPLYVGLQAPCTTDTYRIDPTRAAAQGRESADDAVAQAQLIGLPRGSTLIFDMEAYPTPNAACTTAVLAFMSAWTSRLHDSGYFSGFYSSMASGVADVMSAYQSPQFVRPDYIDFARWDGIATVEDAAIPTGYWSPQRRMKQYVGDHAETYGGVTMSIDNDILDVAPLPATPFGDASGNGWSDVLGRLNSTGELWLYAGNGTNISFRSARGKGWNSMDELSRHGNFDRAGGEDIIARKPSTGELWLYPGTTDGYTTKSLIGRGWNTVREITPFGDFDRDGYADILAVNKSTGALVLYRGTGTSVRAGVQVGSGWNSFDQLVGVGDFNRDGYRDLLARRISTGDLYLYPRLGSGWGTTVRVATGLGGMRSFTNPGDFDRDGFIDVLAISSSGRLTLFRGNGRSLSAGVAINSGWSGIGPLS